VIGKRVVSLLPAATDIVAALDLTGQLVGRTHECDWPAAALVDVPVVTATTLTSGLTSREISAAVAAAGPHGGSSLYDIDLAALAAAAPDVILTQDLCAACAVSYRTVNDAVRVLELDTTVVSLEARTIDGILDSIDAVADLLGVPERAERVRADLDRRLVALPGPGAVAVAFVEWLDPMMPGGHWVPEQIAWAGGCPALARAGEHSTPRPWSALAEADPAVIVFGPCGFSPQQTLRELPAVAAAVPGWAELAAVRGGRVFVVDGPSYFNRPGPRVVDGAEILAGIVAGRPDPGHVVRCSIG
jgi:iron complex transport system substrate-binding protein